MDFSVVNLGADILLFERLLDPELCQHIIQITECYQLEPAKIEIGSVENLIRSNDLLFLGNEYNSLLASTNQLLLEKIKIVQQYLDRDYGVKFTHTETCSILRYQPGQFYQRHIDNFLLSDRFEELDRSIPIRDVSVVGYLNENFTGGETFFDRQGLKVKPQQGSAIVFPSDYTHPHQSLPVITGQKYAFTSWLFH
jgi:prolyl 4-hydroxylase